MTITSRYGIYMENSCAYCGKVYERSYYTTTPDSAYRYCQDCWLFLLELFGGYDNLRVHDALKGS